MTGRAQGHVIITPFGMLPAIAKLQPCRVAEECRFELGSNPRQEQLKTVGICRRGVPSDPNDLVVFWAPATISIRFSLRNSAIKQTGQSERPLVAYNVNLCHTTSRTFLPCIYCRRT